MFFLKMYSPTHFIVLGLKNGLHFNTLSMHQMILF